MSTNITKIFLVLNSGSSSEKFSLYEGEDEVCRNLLHLGAGEDLFDQGGQEFDHHDADDECREKRHDIPHVACEEVRDRGPYFAPIHTVVSF